MLQCAPVTQVDDRSGSLDGSFAAADAATPLEVLRFVRGSGRRGQQVALVTITGLTGSSSRSIGTIMDVDACPAGVITMKVTRFRPPAELRERRR